MINNRWLVELAENNYYKNSAVLPSQFLEEFNNAASWNGWFDGDVNHYLDTHLYSSKQLRERAIKAVKAQEERHKKWLEVIESDDLF